MVDLNLWRIKYNGVSLDFGTHESGHPFTKQVVIGAPDLETDDMLHPASDGRVFGVDRTRGRRLEFAGVHLRSIPQPQPDRRWTQPMDDGAAFEGVWRGRWLRQAEGRMATCESIDRDRMVYGRPRLYVPDLAIARQGWLEYACAFDTVDDRFYARTEQVVVAGVDPGSASVMSFPTGFPAGGTGATETRAWVVNGGTDDTWPIITFRNGGQRPRLDFLDDTGATLWSVNVPDNLAADEEVVIDARPWRRTVTRNGTAATGLLRGSRLDRLTIPPGANELRLVAGDPTGLAEVEVRWRDAFGTL